MICWKFIKSNDERIDVLQVQKFGKRLEVLKPKTLLLYPNKAARTNLQNAFSFIFLIILISPQFVAAETTASKNVYDEIPVYVAIVSAFGVIGALIFNVHNLRRDIMLRNATLITEFNKELGKMFQEETSLVTEEQCKNYIIRYLDALRRVCFLYAHGKIPKEMTGFFDNYFSYGKALAKRYTKVVSDDNFVKGVKPMIDVWLSDKIVNPKKFADALKEKESSNPEYYNSLSRRLQDLIEELKQKIKNSSRKKSRRHKKRKVPHKNFPESLKKYFSPPNSQKDVINKK